MLFVLYSALILQLNTAQIDARYCAISIEDNVKVDSIHLYLGDKLFSNKGNNISITVDYEDMHCLDQIKIIKVFSKKKNFVVYTKLPFRYDVISITIIDKILLRRSSTFMYLARAYDFTEYGTGVVYKKK